MEATAQPETKTLPKGMVKKAGDFISTHFKFLSSFFLACVAVGVWIFKVDAHMETEGHPLLTARVEKNAQTNQELKNSIQSIRQTIREMADKLALKLDGELIRAEFKHLRELLERLEKQMERMADIAETKKKNAGAVARLPTVRNLQEIRKTAARNLARDSLREN